MMKQNYWLISLTAAVALFAAGCGGSTEKPAAPVSQSEAPSSMASGQAEAGAPVSLEFEVIQESMLPPELASWKELKEPPKSTGSARVGDYLYVLVTGGTESIGASAIVPKQVTLVERPTPIVTVAAVISPGKSGAEVNSFPRSYIRVPYAAALPVPGVLISVQWESARSEPTKPANPPADPSTPVSSPVATPSKPADQGAQQPKATTPTPPPVTAPSAPATTSTALTVTTIPESALPASLSAWRSSTVQAPGGVARYVNDSLYLMVSGGEQNSGGYAVEIKSVSLKDGTLFVSAHLHTPKPGQMVTQAITYPKAFARISLAGSGEPRVIVNWQ